MNSTRIIGSVEGQADNQFSQPRGICLDESSKEVFVVDNHNHRVQVFDLRSLAYIRTIAPKISTNTSFFAGGRILNSPVGCELDDQCLYVSDTNNHRIVVFDKTTGEQMRTISQQGSLLGYLNSPYGICIDEETDYLYVADYHNHRVQVFDKESGEFVKSFASGRVTFADEDAHEGDHLQQGSDELLPGNGPGHFNEPISVALDKELSHLFVADFSNNRVQILHSFTGEYITQIGGGLSNEFRGPRGICLDPNSKILFISDRENHRIKLYHKDSLIPIRSLGTSGTVPLAFNRPMELCLCAEEGVLLVVDGYNHRVQVIQVEELHYEKLRIQQKMRTRKEVEEKLKKLPKASATAFEADPSLCEVGLGHQYIHDGPPKITTEVSTFTSPTTTSASKDERVSTYNSVILRFRELGPLYDVETSETEALMADIKITDEELSIHNAHNTYASRLMMDQSLDMPSASDVLMDMQVQSNISMILATHDHITSQMYTKGGTDDNSPPAAFKAQSLIVPPALSLHALIQRGWHCKEDSFPPKIVQLITQLLGNLGDVVTNETEKQNVLSAVVSILDVTSNASSHMAEAVFYSVLDALNILETSIERKLLNRPSPPPPALGLPSSLSRGNSNPGSPLKVGSSPNKNKESVRNVTDMDLFMHETQEEVRDALMASLQLLCDVLLSEGDAYDHLKGGYSTGAKSVYHKDIITLIFGHPFVSAMHTCRKIKASTVIGPDGTNTDSRNENHAYDPRLLPLLGDLFDVIFKLKRFRMKVKQKGGSENDDDSGSTKEKGMEKDKGGKDNRYIYDLQLKALHLAKQHFVTSQKVTQEAFACNEEPTRMMRGGRNIWREGEPMEEGDLVDAMDKEKCWFESIITEIRPGMNVKVHFMGWGSKWDDVIPIRELNSRVAPLNTKTKDWRADLFEGGLIEIKCNEDTVYQKWMWGKIIAMSREEEWVDVSYSFSNEPPVLKRAALYGETICPVGMHTKDRSKAVLATIVRPPKKAEELVQRKEENMDVVAFYDREDDLNRAEDIRDESVLMGDTGDFSEDEEEAGPESKRSTSHVSSNTDPNRNQTRGRGSSPAMVRNESSRDSSSSSFDRDLLRPAPPPLLHQNSSTVELSVDSNPIDLMGRVVFEGIMVELVTVVTSFIPKTSDKGEMSRALNSLINGNTKSTSDGTVNDNASMHTAKADIDKNSDPLFKAALEVLRVIAEGPFLRLLAPYFCRVVTTQCGIRTKLIAARYLKNCPAQVETASDFLLPSSALQKVRSLEHLYCQLIVRCLGDYLSMPIIRRILLKIQATVSKCALSPIASNFTQQLLRSDKASLHSVFIRDLLQNDQRFDGSTSALRNILSNLLQVASHKDRNKISNIWIRCLQNWIVDTCCFKSDDYSVGSRESKVVHNDADYSFDQEYWNNLLDNLIDMLARAKSVSSLEFHEADQCVLAAEIAFYKAFESLPMKVVVSLSRTMATRLSTLLDDSQTMNTVGTSSPFSRSSPPSRFSPSHPGRSPGTPKDGSLQNAITRSIDKAVDLVKVVMNDDVSVYFKQYYERLLANRLLHGNFSISKERSVLQSLPYMHKAYLMLRDVEHADRYMLDFKKHLMNRIDDGLVECSTAIDMVFQSDITGNHFNVNVVPSSAWPVQSTMLSLYHSLALPVELEAIRREFDSFYTGLPHRWKASLEDPNSVSQTFHYSWSGASASAWGMGSEEDVPNGMGSSIAFDSFIRHGSAQGIEQDTVQGSNGMRRERAGTNDSALSELSNGSTMDGSQMGDYSSVTTAFREEDSYDVPSERTHMAKPHKYLSWCHGSGSVTMSLVVQEREVKTFVVNEPICATLMAFNGNSRSNSGDSKKLTIRDLARIINISTEVLSEILDFLCECDYRLLDKDYNEDGDIVYYIRNVSNEDSFLASPGSLSGAIESRGSASKKRGCFSSPSSLASPAATAQGNRSNANHKYEMGLLNERLLSKFSAMETEWIDSLIDASILRYLKVLEGKRHRSAMVLDNVCLHVIDVLRNRSNALFISTTKILERFTWMQDSGLIDPESIARDAEIMSLGTTSKNSNTDVAEVPNGLFASILSVLNLPADTTTISLSSFKSIVMERVCQESLIDTGVKMVARWQQVLQSNNSSNEVGTGEGATGGTAPQSLAQTFPFKQHKKVVQSFMGRSKGTSKDNQLLASDGTQASGEDTSTDLPADSPFNFKSNRSANSPLLLQVPSKDEEDVGRDQEGLIGGFVMPVQDGTIRKIVMALSLAFGTSVSRLVHSEHDISKLLDDMPSNPTVGKTSADTTEEQMVEYALSHYLHSLDDVTTKNLVHTAELDKLRLFQIIFDSLSTATRNSAKQLVVDLCESTSMEEVAWSTKHQVRSDGFFFLASHGQYDPTFLNNLQTMIATKGNNSHGTSILSNTISDNSIADAFPKADFASLVGEVKSEGADFDDGLEDDLEERKFDPSVESSVRSEMKRAGSIVAKPTYLSMEDIFYAAMHYQVRRAGGGLQSSSAPLPASPLHKVIAPFPYGLTDREPSSSSDRSNQWSNLSRGSTGTTGGARSHKRQPSTHKDRSSSLNQSSTLDHSAAGRRVPDRSSSVSGFLGAEEIPLETDYLAPFSFDSTGDSSASFRHLSLRQDGSETEDSHFNRNGASPLNAFLRESTNRDNSNAAAGGLTRFRRSHNQHLGRSEDGVSTRQNLYRRGSKGQRTASEEPSKDYVKVYPVQRDMSTLASLLREYMELCEKRLNTVLRTMIANSSPLSKQESELKHNEDEDDEEEVKDTDFPGDGKSKDDTGKVSPSGASASDQTTTAVVTTIASDLFDNLAMQVHLGDALMCVPYLPSDSPFTGTNARLNEVKGEGMRYSPLTGITVNKAPTSGSSYRSPKCTFSDMMTELISMIERRKGLTRNSYKGIEDEDGYAAEGKSSSAGRRFDNKNKSKATESDFDTSEFRTIQWMDVDEVSGILQSATTPNGMSAFSAHIRQQLLSLLVKVVDITGESVLTVLHHLPQFNWNVRAYTENYFVRYEKSATARQDFYTTEMFKLAIETKQMRIDLQQGIALNLCTVLYGSNTARFTPTSSRGSSRAGSRPGSRPSSRPSSRSNSRPGSRSNSPRPMSRRSSGSNKGSSPYLNQSDLTRKIDNMLQMEMMTAESSDLMTCVMCNRSQGEGKKKTSVNEKKGKSNAVRSNLFTEGSAPEDNGPAAISNRAPTEFMSLPCLHWACYDCWKSHIAKSLPNPETAQYLHAHSSTTAADDEHKYNSLNNTATSDHIPSDSDSDVDSVISSRYANGCHEIYCPCCSTTVTPAFIYHLYNQEEHEVGASKQASSKSDSLVQTEELVERAIRHKIVLAAQEYYDLEVNKLYSLQTTLHRDSLFQDLELSKFFLPESAFSIHRGNSRREGNDDEGVLSDALHWSQRFRQLREQVFRKNIRTGNPHVFHTLQMKVDIFGLLSEAYLVLAELCRLTSIDPLGRGIHVKADLAKQGDQANMNSPRGGDVSMRNENIRNMANTYRHGNKSKGGGASEADLTGVAVTSHRLCTLLCASLRKVVFTLNKTITSNNSQMNFDDSTKRALAELLKATHVLMTNAKAMIRLLATEIDESSIYLKDGNIGIYSEQGGIREEKETRQQQNSATFINPGTATTTIISSFGLESFSTMRTKRVALNPDKNMDTTSETY